MLVGIWESPATPVPENHSLWNAAQSTALSDTFGMIHTLRHFLVFQAFLLWQGGFLFYSAVVVPTGTDIHGQFAQGLVTQRVTDWMNVIGLIWHALFAWDVWATEGRKSWRGLLWFLSFVLLGCLAVLHVKLDRMIELEHVHDSDSMFYQWHAAYLFASSLQWLFALIQVWLTLAAWRAEQSRGSPASSV
jgi:hypothetical protein